MLLIVATFDGSAYAFARFVLKMAKIAVTSDLHFDFTGALTPPEEVRRVAAEMAACHADAIVLAGDIGHPLLNFRGCLDTFIGRCRYVGIVPGNHDVWRDNAHSSSQLWEKVLPTDTRQRGMWWLEQDPIVIDRVAIVGSMTWYDYSAAEPGLLRNNEHYARIKPQISNDAHWIDWPWSDLEVAARLRQRLVSLLERCETHPSIDRVVVVTHVPVFEEQIRRDSLHPAYALSTAFFGNLNAGKDIARFRKVRVVVSGHLHASIRAIVPRNRMPDIHACVVGSDYGAPTWISVEL